MLNANGSERTEDFCLMRRGKTFILDVDSFLLHADEFENDVKAEGTKRKLAAIVDFENDVKAEGTKHHLQNRRGPICLRMM